MSTPQLWSPKNNLQKNNNNKNQLTLRLTQSNQWLGVDHSARIHSLNSPPMTRDYKDDKDVDIYDMLEIYEQFEYILWIINEKKIQKTKKRWNLHTLQKIVYKNQSKMNNKK